MVSTSANTFAPPPPPPPTDKQRLRMALTQNIQLEVYFLQSQLHLVESLVVLFSSHSHCAPDIHVRSTKHYPFLELY